ncbi:aminotransferase-like domain-containing protein [Shewanella violacea]|uniref:Transcriptional regulator, GntR family n=1 Tax=Shewanella violacea (strain JCM 10179 / CIP 106290 / LMG 19151 / DSS12) TaxID=637905 RepID=D4ZCZ4_SHEVD|nr:PLP-dependent aminotransferase family protein [Shewanella violacea]BAJ03889.1 transcriptional regulator, GntR family [Shewanella violacea DSS12]
MAEFKYQKIVDEIIRAIESGIFSDKLGRNKLESVRRYARDKGVGVSTVTQAYYELERLGWIYSEPKRGYFIASRRTLNQPDYGSSIKRVHGELDLASAVQYSFNDPDILPLSCTAPSTVIDQELLLNRLHKQVLRHRPYKLLMQDPIEGIPELRHEICRHLLGSGQVFEKDKVLVTNGRQEGLLLALTAAKSIGKLVAVESPVSFYFQAILKQFNGDVIEVPMQSNYTYELSLLSKAHKEQGFDTYLVNPNFADPTGRVLSVEDKRALIEWAIEHDVTLIEYDRGELYFGGRRPVTIASLVTQTCPCRVISIGDFYDTISPAISLGYLLCSNTFVSCQFAKQTVAEEPSIALQYMVANLMSSGEYKTLLRKLRAQMNVNYQQARSLMLSVLDDSVYMSQPAGGPCIWLKLPEGYSSEKLWARVIKEKLSIAPGAMFSFTHEYDEYFRISFALPWNDKMKYGLVRLAELIQEFIEVEKES